MGHFCLVLFLQTRDDGIFVITLQEKHNEYEYHFSVTMICDVGILSPSGKGVHRVCVFGDLLRRARCDMGFLSNAQCILGYDTPSTQQHLLITYL